MVMVNYTAKKVIAF